MMKVSVHVCVCADIYAQFTYVYSVFDLRNWLQSEHDEANEDFE
jgi:hypothetical protein